MSAAGTHQVTGFEVCPENVHEVSMYQYLDGLSYGRNRFGVASGHVLEVNDHDLDLFVAGNGLVDLVIGLAVDNSHHVRGGSLQDHTCGIMHVSEDQSV